MPLHHLFTLVAGCLPWLLFQIGANVIVRHKHEVKPAYHYDAAAERAGFKEWGRVQDNHKAPHVMLRAERGEVSLTVAIDERVGKERAERLAEELIKGLNWKLTELNVSEQERSLYLMLKSGSPVEPQVPGRYAAALPLPVLRSWLNRLTPDPVPLAVHCPRTPGVSLTPAPLVALSTEAGPYLFSMITAGGDTGALRLEYGIAAADFWRVAFSVLVWLLLPLGAAAVVRWTILKGWLATSRFTHACWIATLVPLVPLVALTLPPAAGLVPHLIPPDWDVPLWGLWLLPVVLPLYLAALGTTLFGHGLGEGADLSEPWPKVLARPLLLGGVALGVGAGLPVLALTWYTHLKLALAAAVLPVLPAVGNWAYWRFRAAPGHIDPGAKAGPVLQRLLAAAQWLALLAGAGWAFLSCLNQQIPLNDFGWQLKTGELIVRQGAIPKVDSFSWTSSGQPFMVQEWLPNVFFYLAYTHLPSWALMVYKAALALLTLALIFGHAHFRTGRPWLAFGATVLCTLVLREFVDIRPGMFSLVFLAALLWGLQAYRMGRAPRLPWLLPILFAIWANTHAGAVIGLLILGLWLVGLVIGHLALGEELPPMRPLVIAAGAAALAVGLNPNGFAIYPYPFWVLGHPTVTDQVNEWVSPNFHHNRWLIYEAQLLLGLLLLGLSRKRSVADALVLLATAHASLVSVRSVSLYVIAATPVLVDAVDSVLSMSRERLRFRPPALPFRVVGAVSAASVLLIAGWGAWPNVSPSEWLNRTGVEGLLPTEAAQSLRAGKWPGRIFNDYGFGGYLIWQLHPRRQVFIDGRAEVHYGTGAFDAAMAIGSAAPGYQNLLDAWGIDTLVLKRGSTLAQRLDEDSRGLWRKVLTGSAEVVYVRADSSADRSENVADTQVKGHHEHR